LFKLIYYGIQIRKIACLAESIGSFRRCSSIVKIFPKDEMYILTSQIKRTADSVSLNIAEGSTGQSNPEFNRFLGMALRSNIEVVGSISLAQRRGYIKEKEFEEIYNACEKLLVMINALRKTLV